MQSTVPADPDAMTTTGEPTPLSRLAHSYAYGRLRRGELTTASAQNILVSLTSLCAVHGRRPVRQLGPPTIDRWLESTTHLSPTTRRNHLSRVRKFCRWLIDTGAIRRDPTRHVPPIRPPRKDPIVLSAEQVAALRTHVAHDLRAAVIVALLWDGSLRCGEVAATRVDDLDPSSRVLHVHGGKGGNERRIVLDHATVDLIARYMDAEGITRGSLLRSRNDPRQGLAPETISNYARNWMYAAGVKIRAFDGRSAHGLRRTGATELMEATDSLVTVQAHLGHQRPETTVKHYLAPVSMAKLRAAADARHATRRDEAA